MDTSFREYVSAKYPALLRTAYLLTGDHHAAEDLLQAALLATMRRWSRVDRQPDAYLRRTMVNLLINRWRRRRFVEVVTAVLPDRAAPPQSTVESRDEVWRALHLVPARTRAVLVLRYWEDLSEAETARVLGCSVGSVKNQASRGLARLRTLLTTPGTAMRAGSVAPRASLLEGTLK